MQKTEPQHSPTHSPTAPHPRKGMAVDSPQGGQIAQLVAMVEASPQAGKLAQFAAMANGNTPMSAQRQAMQTQLSSGGAAIAVRGQEVGNEATVQKVDAAEAPKLKQAYDMASQTGMFDQSAYYNALDELGYPNEGDECEREPDAPLQFKKITIQLARAPYAISGPKSYGGLNDVVYQGDALGNIDFSAPSQYFLGNPYPGLNPIKAGSLLDVGTAVMNYGTGNRYQHFKDANQQQPGHGGVNGSSPPGWTWHHLSAHHQMHLVDRLVHSKHGHNGGVHIW